MLSFDTNKVLCALQQVIPRESDQQFISLHEPRFAGNEWTYVKECLDTGWVSSVGKFVDRFEADLASYTGHKYAVAVVNGTAALHVCLQLVGVKADDEVLIPSLTFVATANAVTYCNAIPHFVESEEATLGIDAQKLETYLTKIAAVRNGESVNTQSGRRIKAVMPMHTFGHPVDLDGLTQVCARFHLELVEDAAEALGSTYHGRHVGHWGRMSALSFNGNKVITTGGGGAILTNDEHLARQAKHLTTTAKVPHRWAFNHDHIAYNYRLPNINAALGCAQLEQLPHFLQNKRALAQSYAQALEGIEGVRFVTEPKHAHSNYWLNALLLDESHSKYLEPLLELTNAQNLMTRPAWTPLHQLPMYQECPRMNLSVAQSLAQRLLNLPSSAHLHQSTLEARVVGARVPTCGQGVKP